MAATSLKAILSGRIIPSLTSAVKALGNRAAGVGSSTAQPFQIFQVWHSLSVISFPHIRRVFHLGHCLFSLCKKHFLDQRIQKMYYLIWNTTSISHICRQSARQPRGWRGIIIHSAAVSDLPGLTLPLSDYYYIIPPMCRLVHPEYRLFPQCTYISLDRSIPPRLWFNTVNIMIITDWDTCKNPKEAGITAESAGNWNSYTNT